MMIRRIAALLLITALTIIPLPARAASPDSLYHYTLDGTTATVANTATANAGVNLTLQGAWSAAVGGVQFTGNTTNAQSVGWAKPASGYTISAAATTAVGATIKFTYQAPQSGQCFKDSPNMTQIGKFGSNVAQVKLQLSNCGKNATNVFAQCRMAGASTSSSVLPVTSTQPLVNGETYVISCVKAPDPASGNTTVYLRTVRLDAVNGNQVTNNTFSVARTGKIQSSAYLSIANKYPLPSQTNNTDQFVSIVSQVAYCQSSSVALAQACLAAEVPEL